MIDRKKVLGLLAIAATALGSVTAQAVPFVWTDHIGTTHFLDPGSTYSYQHDIRDNGFNVGVDTALTGLLTVILTANTTGAEEYARISVDCLLCGSQTQAIDINNDFYFITLLENDGLLNVTLRHRGSTANGSNPTGGDQIRRVNSIWEVKGNETRPQEVPEPTTLALFGLGLAGMGLARSRRRSN